MKLALGAAQFGLNYGISNSSGKTSPDEVQKILALAREFGVQVIDTAPAYGDSEQVLGELLRERRDFRVFTKTSKTVTPESLKAEVGESLKRLQSDSLAALLCHDPASLTGVQGKTLMQAAQELKASGQIQKVGVSVYTAEEIDRILDHLEIDAIQVPFNIFDQRLRRSGHLKKLKDHGVEVHARSAFLQGLLTFPEKKLDPHFDSIREHLKMFREHGAKLGISVVELCLAYVIQVHEIDAVVCGVNDCVQFAELCQIAQRASGRVLGDVDRFALNDPTILNPSLWRLKGGRQ